MTMHKLCVTTHPKPPDAMTDTCLELALPSALARHGAHPIDGDQSADHRDGRARPNPSIDHTE